MVPMRGTQADPPQRLEGGLEQGVHPFGPGAQVGVDQADGLLVIDEPPTGGLLDRDPDRRRFALVARPARQGRWAAALAITGRTLC